MATPVIMPRQGQSVESCIITKWHKAKGDSVSPGEILFSYETDKATFDEEAKAEGEMLAVFFEEGDDVPCLTNVCVIGNPQEDASSFAPGGIEEAAADKTDSPSAPVQAAPLQAQVMSDGQAPLSPRARKLAERMRVDARFAVPTGPNGRVIARDIQALGQEGVFVTAAAGALAQPGMPLEGTGLGGRVVTGDIQAASAVEESAAPAYEDVKMSNIRKVIAKTMHQSLSGMAQLTHNASFDATDVLAFRKRLKAQGEKLGLANVTLNDIILYAVSRTLPRHPELNAHLLDDTLRLFKDVHLGIAVDTPRGLMVPTLLYANRKSLSEISADAKQLAASCTAGTISPDLLRGGSFTISNLGVLDIESFTPVINPPQTGILGVNCIVERVRQADSGLSVYPSMGLSLTYDHRALDGAPASRFLKELKLMLENFSLMLAL